MEELFDLSKIIDELMSENRKNEKHKRLNNTLRTND